MQLKCGENQRNENQNLKENPQGKLEIKMKKLNQNLFPKTLFFEFPNPSKNTKQIVQFKAQKLFLIAVKTPESKEKFAQKILEKTGH